jgi:hypothetical protein
MNRIFAEKLILENEYIDLKNVFSQGNFYNPLYNRMKRKPAYNTRYKTLGGKW